MLGRVTGCDRTVYADWRAGFVYIAVMIIEHYLWTEVRNMKGRALLIRLRLQRDLNHTTAYPSPRILIQNDCRLGHDNSTQ